MVVVSVEVMVVVAVVVVVVMVTAGGGEHHKEDRIISVRVLPRRCPYARGPVVLYPLSRFDCGRVCTM